MCKISNRFSNFVFILVQIIAWCYPLYVLYLKELKHVIHKNSGAVEKLQKLVIFLFFVNSNLWF